MSTLSTYRERLAEWCWDIYDRWCVFRADTGQRVTELGRRIGISKREEIAELRMELEDLSERFKKVASSVMFLRAKDQIDEAWKKAEGALKDAEPVVERPTSMGTKPALMSVTERSAQPGETCGCGRPAHTVFVRDDGSEVGYCGQPDEEMAA